MSTHNIGHYEDLTKIIFELSSNIIKYAPYFFFWIPYHTVHKNQARGIKNNNAQLIDQLSMKLILLIDVKMSTIVSKITAQDK